jgi:hypothetical protein
VPSWSSTASGRPRTQLKQVRWSRPSHAFSTPRTPRALATRTPVALSTRRAGRCAALAATGRWVGTTAHGRHEVGDRPIRAIPGCGRGGPESSPRSRACSSPFSASRNTRLNSDGPASWRVHHAGAAVWHPPLTSSGTPACFSKLAYLTPCRSIQLLVLLAGGDTAKDLERRCCVRCDHRRAARLPI